MGAQKQLGISSVLGLPVHLSDDYLGWLISQLQQNQGVHIVTLNAEMAIQAEQNEALATVIRKAELVIPDGAGVVLYLRSRGKPIQRCPGIELAEALLRQSATLDRPSSVFFYGGAPGVCQTAATQFQQKIPGLTIAGTQHGYLSSDEQAQLLQTLQHLQPQIILVGLGVPRQELWIMAHRYLCPDAIWIGVGGSFDIWAGIKTRAPGWLRNNHLEWVYRLYQEPWRWRRMLALPKFAWRALVHSGG
ncbi:MAG: WecB/TagA/CpsF family glycosyltransferase [Cyanobacteria bacterium CRU_2_1]|nr:WecB/TagA/CpsF family glycosyltransferase [Cyanobacteria bacterium RU_5_0]NJR63222.1 WecB/TagA/CpsF family glycosyltransferase [Cyanobacteria bacterium CRU_2_1]